MKNIEEIKKTPGIVIKKEGPDGFGGSVFPIEYKNGKVKVIKNIDKEIPTPPSIMLGFRKGKEAEDIAQLINFYEDMPKWKKE